MWFLATRNRPELVQALIASMNETGDIPTVAVMQDDCQYGIKWPPHWHIHRSDEHLEMAGALNAMFPLYPSESFYGMLDDHTHPISAQWSRWIEESAGLIGIASGWNTVNREKNGRMRINNYCLGGELARALGWIWPNFVTHMYGDDVLEDIGYELGIMRFVKSSVFKTHLLRDGSLKADGNSHRLFRGQPYLASDKYAYEQWKAKRFSNVIEMLRPLVNSHHGNAGVDAL